MSEGNEGEESYVQMTQEEGVDDIDSTDNPLLRASNEGDIITANGEIVGELVMEDGDPSVIVESIVNADGSVFVDERDFNSYCNNHLSHTVDDSHSPDSHSQVLDIGTISDSVDIDQITKTSSASPVPMQHVDSLSNETNMEPVSPTEEPHDDRIWIMKGSTTVETVADGCTENDAAALTKTTSVAAEGCNDVNDVVFTDEASQQLLLEQLAVLRAEKEKLFHETEMLKLKKDKLKLQISCSTNKLKKQEMEQEKLGLEIKLLKSKVVDDANDVSHYIFVP